MKISRYPWVWMRLCPLLCLGQEVRVGWGVRVGVGMSWKCIHGIHSNPELFRNSLDKELSQHSIPCFWWKEHLLWNIAPPHPTPPPHPPLTPPPPPPQDVFINLYHACWVKMHPEHYIFAQYSVIFANFCLKFQECLKYINTHRMDLKLVNRYNK
jgi:hypothetical protein